jgi:hypothetical protein
MTGPKKIYVYMAWASLALSVAAYLVGFFPNLSDLGWVRRGYSPGSGEFPSTSFPFICAFLAGEVLALVVGGVSRAGLPKASAAYGVARAGCYVSVVLLILWVTYLLSPLLFVMLHA